MEKIKKGFLLIRYKKFFLILELGSSISGNIRDFFGVIFLFFYVFYVSGLGGARFHFRKYKKVSILRNIIKAFLWENMVILLILEQDSSILRHIRNFGEGWSFFVFRESGYITAGAVHLDTPFEGFVFSYSKLISYWFDCLER